MTSKEGKKEKWARENRSVFYLGTNLASRWEGVRLPQVSGKTSPRSAPFSGKPDTLSGSRGCLEEGCLGLPDVFPDIFWTAIFPRK